MDTETTSSLPVALKHSITESDARLRRLVTWTGVVGTGVLTSFFFAFLAYQSLRGGLEPTNWLIHLTRDHYAALVGTPMSAISAFCIVSLLKVTSGPIEFEAFGLKFHGASGPIILWVICFLSVTAAFHLLWTDLAIH